MDNYLFSVFPLENFIDLALYQSGWSQCFRHILWSCSVKIIIYFIMSFQVPEYSLPKTQKAAPPSIILKAEKAL